MKISRILKDYRETGALSSLIGLWGFVDETTFLTKSGAVGVTYAVDGADDECLDHADRQRIVRRFEQALRQLDERFRIYQYRVKRHAVLPVASSHPNPLVHDALARRAAYLATKADQLYVVDLRLVILFEGWTGAPSAAARIRQFARRGRGMATLRPPGTTSLGTVPPV